MLETDMTHRIIVQRERKGSPHDELRWKETQVTRRTERIDVLKENKPKGRLKEKKKYFWRNVEEEEQQG